MATISPEIIKWCEANGFTDPQVIDGEVWAFNSMSVIPVPTGYKIKKNLTWSQLEFEELIREYATRIAPQQLAAQLFCARVFSRRPRFLTIGLPNPVRLSISNLSISFLDHLTSIEFQGFTSEQLRIPQSSFYKSNYDSIEAIDLINFNLVNEDGQYYDFNGHIMSMDIEMKNNYFSSGCQTNIKIELKLQI